MKRVVIYHDTVLELLEDIPHSQHDATTLVVCSTREDFLQQLLSSLSQHQQAQAFDLKENEPEDQSSDITQTHPLLVPTLQLLSISKAIKLAFCPSIDALRAYASTFAAPDPAEPCSRPSLLIVDLILLHHATSEFSVQGLMRSLASAVEAAARNHMDLRLCECRDVHDLQNPDRGPKLWDAEVPLLSGSVRLRGEDAAWSQRMISLRSIAGRWFEFEKQKRESDEEVNEDEEMLV
jgi:hypothetical protein